MTKTILLLLVLVFSTLPAHAQFRDMTDKEKHFLFSGDVGTRILKAYNANGSKGLIELIDADRDAKELFFRAVTYKAFHAALVASAEKKFFSIDARKARAELHTSYRESMGYTGRLLAQFVDDKGEPLSFDKGWVKFNEHANQDKSSYVSGAGRYTEFLMTTMSPNFRPVRHLDYNAYLSLWERSGRQIAVALGVASIALFFWVFRLWKRRWK